MKSWVIALFLLAGGAQAHSQQGKPISDAISVVPSGGIQLESFQLTDPTGAKVSFPDASRDKTALVYFGFTTCTDACPLAAAYIKGELNKLAKSTTSPNFYFISVDPEADTPKKVSTWLKVFDPKWVGLLGNKEALYRAAKPFGASFEKALPEAKATEKVLHSSIVYLVTPEGKWTHYLRLPAKKGILTRALDDLTPKKAN